ncbi:MAG: hypothetical protein U0103_22890, partial [Candidatus Obscuribacterales bacterium]
LTSGLVHIGTGDQESPHLVSVRANPRRYKLTDGRPKQKNSLSNHELRVKLTFDSFKTISLVHSNQRPDPKYHKLALL